MEFIAKVKKFYDVYKIHTVNSNTQNRFKVKGCKKKYIYIYINTMQNRVGVATTIFLKKTSR